MKTRPISVCEDASTLKKGLKVVVEAGGNYESLRVVHANHIFSLQQWEYELCVLGSGDFGRSLAAHAQNMGVSVVVGSSRDNATKTASLFGLKSPLQVLPAVEAVAAAPIVVAAVYWEKYRNLPIDELV